MLFKNLKPAKPDPIFGLYEAFLKDPRKEKINLGIGIYADQTLSHWALPSVEKAIAKNAQNFLVADYLPIAGDTSFTQLLGEEILGRPLDSRSIQIQTLGGTGALFLAGRFSYEIGIQKVYLPDPTWPNHLNIFSKNSLSLHFYPYYSTEKSKVDFSALLQVLEENNEPSLLLLHAVCHNPSGQDFSKEQWQKLGELILKKKNYLPLFDLAYHGFSQDETKDLYPLHLFQNKGITYLTAYSCSKNFGLYRHRLGMLLGVFQEEENAKKALGLWKFLVRVNYSNPPFFGALVVKTLLGEKTLKEAWKKDLQAMRTRMETSRNLFYEALKKQGKDLSYLPLQKGMFSLLPLTEMQTEELKEKHAIYLPSNGRINFCGINSNNLERILTAMKKVHL